MADYWDTWHANEGPEQPPKSGPIHRSAPALARTGIQDADVSIKLDQGKHLHLRVSDHSVVVEID